MGFPHAQPTGLDSRHSLSPVVEAGTPAPGVGGAGPPEAPPGPSGRVSQDTSPDLTVPSPPL